MNLYVLRHGIAEDYADSGRDSDRKLTEEGILKIKASARALQLLDISFDLILASPFARARKTAELVAQGLGLLDSVQICPALASGEPLEPVLGILSQEFRTKDSILITGHEPDLSRLVSIYISGGTRVPVTMKKGGLARISFPEAPMAGKGVLDWLLAPKHLVAIGRVD